MIDLNTETVLALPQAAKRIPCNRDGKQTHVSTLMRWIQKGVKGVRLEATKPGGRWLTSVEALQRFSDKLAQAEGVEIVPEPRSSRHLSATRAAEELDRLGY